jgi:hypothetical protein
MAYKTIPVDEETYDMVQQLCEAYEMGKRSQGAIVKKLVKADYQKLKSVKLIGLAQVDNSAAIEHVSKTA